MSLQVWVVVLASMLDAISLTLTDVVDFVL